MLRCIKRTFFLYTNHTRKEGKNYATPQFYFSLDAFCPFGILASALRCGHASLTGGFPARRTAFRQGGLSFISVLCLYLGRMGKANHVNRKTLFRKVLFIFRHHVILRHRRGVQIIRHKGGDDSQGIQLLKREGEKPGIIRFKADLPILLQDLKIKGQKTPMG